MMSTVSKVLYTTSASVPRRRSENPSDCKRTVLGGFFGTQSPGSPHYADCPKGRLLSEPKATFHQGATQHQQQQHQQ